MERTEWSSKGEILQGNISQKAFNFIKSFDRVKLPKLKCLFGKLLVFKWYILYN